MARQEIVMTEDTARRVARAVGIAERLSMEPDNEQPVRSFATRSDTRSVAVLLSNLYSKAGGTHIYGGYIVKYDDSGSGSGASCGPWKHIGDTPIYCRIFVNANDAGGVVLGETVLTGLVVGMNVSDPSNQFAIVLHSSSCNLKCGGAGPFYSATRAAPIRCVSGVQYQDTYVETFEIDEYGCIKVTVSDPKTIAVGCCDCGASGGQCTDCTNFEDTLASLCITFNVSDSDTIPPEYLNGDTWQYIDGLTVKVPSFPGTGSPYITTIWSDVVPLYGSPPSSGCGSWKTEISIRCTSVNSSPPGSPPVITALYEVYVRTQLYTLETNPPTPFHGDYVYYAFTATIPASSATCSPFYGEFTDFVTFGTGAGQSWYPMNAGSSVIVEETTCDLGQTNPPDCGSGSGTPPYLCGMQDGDSVSLIIPDGPNAGTYPGTLIEGAGTGTLKADLGTVGTVYIDATHVWTSCGPVAYDVQCLSPGIVASFYGNPTCWGNTGDAVLTV